MPIFRFIDLFAGIGGIRIAFKDAGGVCVFSSEYDRFAQITYKEFFDESPDFQDLYPVDPPGDITKIPNDMLGEVIPEHDILTAGFPCQPFSKAGVSKKKSLGRPHGFDDPTQGTLFFNIKEIINAKKPKAFLLENVKHLRGHDHGKTYRVIRDVLEELDYEVFDHVIDAAGWVPQHRERIYLIGFRRPEAGIQQTWRVESFDGLYELNPPNGDYLLKDILEENVDEKYILGDGTWSTLLRHRKHHEDIGQGFGYGMNEHPFENHTRTLSARYHKDGAEILVSKGDGKNPRRLTPFECAGLMGFPPKYQEYFHRDPKDERRVSDTQAYRQLGNSVAVPLVIDIARLMVKKMQEVGALSEANA